MKKRFDFWKVSKRKRKWHWGTKRHQWAKVNYFITPDCITNIYPGNLSYRSLNICDAKSYIRFSAVFVQLFRNQQQITSSARLSTIGDGNRHGKKRKQERVAGAFHSPSAQGTNLQPAFFKPKCLIFDKDGTLVCFHTMWSPWATDLAER